MNQQVSVEARLGPKEASPSFPRSLWPGTARASWGLIALTTVGLVPAGIPARYDELLAEAAEDARAFDELGVSGDFFASYVSFLGMFAVLVHVLIAGVLSWRRPDDRMALFVSFVLLTNGAINPLSPLHAMVTEYGFLDQAVGLMVYFGLVSALMLLYVFPNGRFVPWWTILLAAGWAVTAFPSIFFADAGVSFLTWPVVIQVLLLLGWAGSAVFAQVYRYVNVSSPVQRQQAKWAIVGLAAAVVGPLAYFLPSFILPSLGDSDMPNFAYQRVGASLFTFSLMLRLIGLTALTTFMLLFPVSFAIATLRYKLWDIGVVANRALVYGALTVALAAIYFGSIVLLQLAFRAVTDQGTPVVVVASTLAIATMFQPLRRRLQGFIDRRFYRSKYDAAQTLEAFSVMLRDEVDLERLSEALVGVVEETMQPTHVSLWLRAPSTRRDKEPSRRI